MGFTIHPSALIRTSFVLSGLLGVRFDGIPNGDGRTISIEGMIPIQVACKNQTTPLQVLNSFSKISKQMLALGKTKSAYGSTSKYNASKPPPYSSVSDMRLSPVIGRNNGMKENSKDNLSAPGMNLYGNEPSTQKGLPNQGTGKQLAVIVTVPEADNSKEFVIESTPQSESCKGTGCAANETCVTWIKDGMESKNMSQGTQTLVLTECIETPVDNVLNFAPINPKKVRLCPQGQTHSVKVGPLQAKCDGKQSQCPIVWNYTCVAESESPHNCKLRKCPMDACVQQMSCGESRLCIPEATCLPPYFFPSS